MHDGLSPVRLLVKVDDAGNLLAGTVFRPPPALNAGLRPTASSTAGDRQAPVPGSLGPPVAHLGQLLITPCAGRLPPVPLTSLGLKTLTPSAPAAVFAFTTPTLDLARLIAGRSPGPPDERQGQCWFPRLQTCRAPAGPGPYHHDCNQATLTCAVLAERATAPYGSPETAT